nr:MAG TPA: hypothetical protein [Caudoviricetes sp.]
MCVLYCATWTHLNDAQVTDRQEARSNGRLHGAQ